MPTLNCGSLRSVRQSAIGAPKPQACLLLNWVQHHVVCCAPCPTNLWQTNVLRLHVEMVQWIPHSLDASEADASHTTTQTPVWSSNNTTTQTPRMCNSNTSTQTVLQDPNSHTTAASSATVCLRPSHKACFVLHVVENMPQSTSSRASVVADLPQQYYIV